MLLETTKKDFYTPINFLVNQIIKIPAINKKFEHQQAK